MQFVPVMAKMFFYILYFIFFRTAWSVEVQMKAFIWNIHILWRYVFTDTFDQIDISLLKKNINFFQKKKEVFVEINPA